MRRDCPRFGLIDQIPISVTLILPISLRLTLMDLPVILALAIIVGVAAYALGTYLNRHGGMPSMPRPLRAPPAQRLPGRVTEEREVQALVNWLQIGRAHV